MSSMKVKPNSIKPGMFSGECVVNLTLADGTEEFFIVERGHVDADGMLTVRTGDGGRTAWVPCPQPEWRALQLAAKENDNSK